MSEVKTLDDVVSMLATEKYYWVQTKDDDGFWIKAADTINSYFLREVKMDARKFARNILNRIDKHSTRNVTEVLNRLQEMNTFKIKEFDADPTVIHFNNKIFFVRENLLLPRRSLSSDQYIQVQKLQDTHNIKSFIMIPFDFPDGETLCNNPPAQVIAAATGQATLPKAPTTAEIPDCPKFKAFLAKIIPNQTALMWEWIAYLLTPGVYMKKAVFMIGETDTGKTTLVTILRHVIGFENCAEETFHALCSSPFSRGNLEGKLLNYDDDVSGLVIRDPAEFKKLTGDIWLRVERKYMNQYIVKNTCKLMFSTNKIPLIEHLDNATANRIILFFFNHQFTNAEKDPGFVESIINDPREIQGILYNALKALPVLLQRKRFETMDIASVLHFLRMAIEPVYMFLCMCCVGIIEDFKEKAKAKTKNPGEEPEREKSAWKTYSVDSETLFDEFTTWAAATGREGKDKESRISTQNKFTGILRQYGILSSVDRVPIANPVDGKKSRTIRVYHGVKFRPDFDQYKEKCYPENIDDLMPQTLKEAMERAQNAKGTPDEAQAEEDLQAMINAELLSRERTAKKVAEYMKKQESEKFTENRPDDEFEINEEPRPDDNDDI